MTFTPPQKYRSTSAIRDGRVSKTPWDVRSLGVVVGLAGGMVAFLFGSVFTAISWFTQADSVIKTMGTVLLFMTIPLLIFGAVCLDSLEKKKKMEKESRFHEMDW
jgi:hypothetical protein